MKAHFHHVHLNVTDLDSTITYYEKFFGASRVKYRNRSDALFTEKSFLLLDLVESAPPSHFGSSLWHIGWSGVDGPSEFDWRVKAGIAVHTPITPLGDNHWMYFWGPEKEVVEVYTGNKNHRFEHVHLFASDVDRTIEWFEVNLGLSPVNEKSLEWDGFFKWNTIVVNNVNVIVFGNPTEQLPWWPEGDYKETDGTSIDHIGFSYRDIGPVYDQMRSAEVEIVHEIKTDPAHGFLSFFVRGPDGLLIEIVQERPVPEGVWDED